MPLPYLIELGNRLTNGLASLPADRRERHRAFVLSRQMPDGGFAGREDGSDLYYTAFAVRSLAVLNVMSAEDGERLVPFLRQQARGQLTVIDLVSWLYSALVVQSCAQVDLLEEFHPEWPTRLAEMLETFRTRDGGYAKTLEGAAGSTYHSFLVALCYELVGQPLPEPNRLVQFVFDRQREDGGFVEIAPMKRSGTNPTAAAAALLRMFNALDDELRDDMTAFLKEVRGDEGGFQANTRIPFSDGLSTFTALLTIQDLKLPGLYDSARVREFIDGLEFPGGGFRGAQWDTQADVEYTFYALGVLGLLA